MNFKRIALAVLLICAALTINQASAEDVTTAIYNHLNWSAQDTGFNEGGLCGFQTLQGIAGIQLPELPFEYYALGNYWPRSAMMSAAEEAYELGFRDAAVTAATCSQRHNPNAYPLLLAHPDIVAEWLAD